jgi:8-oxo-dGTP pyrophosphatase MutT (NUDIX family)
MNPTPHGDEHAVKFPVSVKGVLIHDDKVLLLKNERDEWELPGGKLELGEEPDECLAREIFEETGISAFATQPLRPYVYMVAEVVPVLIVPFLCQCKDFGSLRISLEHKGIGTFALAELGDINLPVGYRLAIQAAAAMSIRF